MKDLIDLVLRLFFNRFLNSEMFTHYHNTK